MLIKGGPYTGKPDHAAWLAYADGRIAGQERARIAAQADAAERGELLGFWWAAQQY